MVTFEEAKQNFFIANSSANVKDVVNDDEKAYLLTELSSSDYTTSAVDLWKQWFVAQGYTTGSLAERWWKFLVASGYTQGHLREKQKKYFEDNS